MTAENRVFLLLEKTRMNPSTFSQKTGINEEKIILAQKGAAKFDLDELVNISDFFKVSLNYFVKGTEDDKDKAQISQLRPSDQQILEDFLNKCKAVVEKAGLSKFMDILIPQPVFIERNGQKIQTKKFFGGVFLVDKSDYFISDMPYIDFPKLLALDNYDIYSKLKSHPRTFGQMRWIIKKTNDGEGFRQTNPKYSENTNDWEKEKPVPQTTFEDIKNLTKVEFFAEICESREGWSGADVLYSIDENHPNYWAIIKLFLQNGAYLSRIHGENQFGSPKYVKDEPATAMLKKMAGLE